jgi:hypothetical protein
MQVFCLDFYIFLIGAIFRLIFLVQNQEKLIVASSQVILVITHCQNLGCSTRFQEEKSATLLNVFLVIQGTLYAQEVLLEDAFVVFLILYGLLKKFASLCNSSFSMFSSGSSPKNLLGGF